LLSEFLSGCIRLILSCVSALLFARIFRPDGIDANPNPTRFDPNAGSPTAPA
jgi:hypothetical protein